MTTTERLYYNDPYTLQFEAQAIEQTTYKQHPAIVLDRTYFYPEGGGQPADNGVINGVPVLDVQTRDSDRAVLHILERELPDTHIEGHIEATRRADFMHHHSGQHILSQALSQAARAETASVHMSADSMTIDVGRINLTSDEWIAAEELANQIIRENRNVRTWFPEPEELPTLHLRKLPDVVGKVRVVDIGGFDVTACGGTHVAHTGELGLIKIVRLERHGETTRIEFKCSSRALSDYRDKNDVINRLTSDLTVGYRDLGETLARLQSDNKSLKTDLKALHEQLADAEAATLLASTPVQEGRRVILHAFENRDPNEVKLLAQKVIAPPGVIALFGVAGDKTQLFFGRSEDVSVDVVPLLKQALAAIKCDRGGGRPNFAQGGGVPATLAEVNAALEMAGRQLSSHLM